MKIFIENGAEPFAYDIECLAMLFTREKLTLLRQPCPMEPEGDFLVVDARREDPALLLSARSRVGGCQDRREARVPAMEAGDPKRCQIHLGVLLYRLLSGLTGIAPPWGILTGIRPVKLFRHCLESNVPGEETIRYFQEDYLVSPEKASLALETAQAERAVLNRIRPDGYSLYISIPFCPSRCAYCSFVSHAIDKAKKLVEPYVDLLCRELEATAEMAGRLGLRLQAVYMGGGTPTTLTASQMGRITRALSSLFDLSRLEEYCVEAGRPDTITREKLEGLFQAGVTRISINPQTFQDPVLQAVGRKHSAEDIFQAYSMARDIGFDNINMDFIAGLPSDTPEGFFMSMETAVTLAPENITVHTLSRKRASEIGRDEAAAGLGGGAVREMVGFARSRLAAAGYHPYYLYRQKNTADNLENTGYCLAGRESYYNIAIMEELQTIVAAGAGGVTKWRSPDGSLIKRVFNYKYPYEYISRFDDILERKKQVEAFYDNADHAAQLQHNAD